MLEKFHENAVEYIALMLIAGVIMFIVFLPIDPSFSTCCFLSSVVLALLMFAASIVLDIQEKR